MNSPQSLALQNAIKQILRTSQPIEAPTTSYTLVCTSQQSLASLSTSLLTILSHKLKLGIATHQLLSIIPLPEHLHSQIIQSQSIDCLIYAHGLPTLFLKILEMKEFLVNEYYENDEALCLGEDFVLYCVQLLRQLDSVTFEESLAEDTELITDAQKRSSLPSEKSKKDSTSKKKKKKRRKRIVEFGDEVVIREGKERPKKRRLKAVKSDDMIDVIGNEQVDSFANEQRKRLSVVNEVLGLDLASGPALNSAERNTTETDSVSDSAEASNATPVSALPETVPFEEKDIPEPQVAIDTRPPEYSELLESSIRIGSESTSSIQVDEVPRVQEDSAPAFEVSEQIDPSIVEVSKEIVERITTTFSAETIAPAQEEDVAIEVIAQEPSLQEADSAKNDSSLGSDQNVSDEDMYAESPLSGQKQLEENGFDINDRSVEVADDEEQPAPEQVLDTEVSLPADHEELPVPAERDEIPVPVEHDEIPQEEELHENDSGAPEESLDELPPSAERDQVPQEEVLRESTASQTLAVEDNIPEAEDSQSLSLNEDEIEDTTTNASADNMDAQQLVEQQQSSSSSTHIESLQPQLITNDEAHIITETSLDIINRVTSTFENELIFPAQEEKHTSSTEPSTQSPIDTHTSTTIDENATTINNEPAPSISATLKNSTLAEISDMPQQHVDESSPQSPSVSDHMSSNLGDSPRAAAAAPLTPLKTFDEAHLQMLDHSPPGSQKDTIMVRSVPLSPISLPPQHELNGMMDSPLSSPVSMRMKSSKRKHYLLATRGQLECRACTDAAAAEMLEFSHSHGALFTVHDDDLNAILRSQLQKPKVARKIVFEALNFSLLMTRDLSSLDPVTRVRVENFTKRIWFVQVRKFYTRSYISQQLSRLCNLETPEEVFSEASADWHSLINLSARISDWNELLRKREKQLLKRWALKNHIKSSTTHTGSPSEHTMDFASSPDVESDQIMSKSVQDRDRMVDQLLRYPYSPNTVQQLTQGTSPGNDISTVDIDTLLNDSADDGGRAFRGESMHEILESPDDDNSHSHSRSYSMDHSTASGGSSTQRSAASTSRKIAPPAFSQHIKLFVKPQPPKFSRSALMTEQNGLCGGCGTNLHKHYGLFRKPRLCYYAQKLYCRSCHNNDKMVIPARVLHSWDFTKKHVCNGARDYLQAIHREPLLCVSAINPSLFDQVPNLKKARKIRSLLMKQWDIIKDCPQQSDVIRPFLPDYRTLGYVKDTEMYSLDNLENLNKPMRSSPFLRQLASIFHRFNTHIVDECTQVCKPKASEICAGCKNPKPIYRFQLRGTAVCPKCNRLFHSRCIKVHILHSGGHCQDGIGT